MVNEENLAAAFLNRAEEYGGRVALKAKRDGLYHDISWREFKENVIHTALGLVELGIKEEDRVCILSENRPEWAYADLAIISCRAISVPIYSTNSPPEVEYILRDCGARLIFVSTKEQLDKILSVKSGLPSLERAVLFDGQGARGDFIISFDELLERGKRLLSMRPGLYSERVNKINRDDLATIIYTSGTTGEPKGVMLAHDNLLSNIRACSEILDVGERDIHLSFLPLSHIFERMAGFYFMLYNGATIAYSDNIDKVAEDIHKMRPTVMTGVPRFYEKLHARVMDAVAGSGALKKALFTWAIEVGRRYALARIEKRKVSIWLALKRAAADKLVFHKLKERLGGRLRFFISGGAPLARDIAEFFYSAGILILEGYGLTETSPVITVNRVGSFKFGTVGKPVPGVMLSLAEDGEILMKGPNVMKGYYNKPLETQEVLKDGWFYTGDIGEVDADGFLKITDRKKELIVTAGGKKIAPSFVEALLKSDRFVQDAFVYGDKHKYAVALIVPNFDALKRYAEFKKIPYSKIDDLVRNSRINGLIMRRVERRQGTLSQYEKVKRIALLPRDFTREEGELTPTMKLKRRVVGERYKDMIEGLYKDEVA